MNYAKDNSGGGEPDLNGTGELIQTACTGGVAMPFGGDVIMTPITAIVPFGTNTVWDATVNIPNDSLFETTATEGIYKLSTEVALQIPDSASAGNYFAVLTINVSGGLSVQGGVANFRRYFAALVTGEQNHIVPVSIVTDLSGAVGTTEISLVVSGAANDITVPNQTLNWVIERLQ